MTQSGEAVETTRTRVWLKRAGFALAFLLWLSVGVAFTFYSGAKFPSGSRLVDALLILAAVVTLLQFGEALLGGLWALVRLPWDKKAGHHSADDVDHGESNR